MMTRRPSRSNGEKDPLWYRAALWCFVVLGVMGAVVMAIGIDREVTRRSALAKQTPYEQDLWYFSTYTQYRRDPRTDLCFSINPPHGYSNVPCSPTVLKMIEERAD